MSAYLPAMHIDSYSFGRIVIDGELYTNDVVIHPNKIVSWWRRSGHLVTPEDLDIEGMENLIIGSGAFGFMKVSQEFIELSKSYGIKLRIEKTKKACEIYNREDNCHAALHITC